MAVNSPIAGKLFRISQATTLAGTYALVKGMNAFDMNSNRTTETTDTFDAAVAYSEPGPRERNYTVNGLLIPDDPGQVAVRGFEATDTAFYVKILPLGGSTDGAENVRGYTHLVKCGSLRHGAAVTGAQTWGFDLLSQADPVATSGGYVI